MAKKMTTKPVCECGKRLTYCKQMSYTETFDILDNDKAAVEIKEIHSSGLPIGGDFLRCKECKAEYSCKVDPNGRIIKGDRSFFH